MYSVEEILKYEFHLGGLFIIVGDLEVEPGLELPLGSGILAVFCRSEIELFLLLNMVI